MRIAILEWGSAVWDLRGLEVTASTWRPDGPVLPIEFARVPPAELTSVLCAETWVLPVQTLWARSARTDLGEACKDLAQRAQIPPGQIATQIGVLSQTEVRIQRLVAADNTNDITQQTADRIRYWLNAHSEVDAVIWRDSRASWGEDPFPQPPTNVEKIVGYLLGLTAETSEKARKNFRVAPFQLWTAARAKISMQAGWSPQPTRWIHTADDIRYKEWEQCWAIIGRLDTILADLRKLGFSFVTGLLTASAFLGFIGVPTAQGVHEPPAVVRGAAFVAVMALVVTLFFVDSYYQILHSGAAERALDLESLTDPPLRTAKYLSSNASMTKIKVITVGLYVGLLLVTVILGVLSVLPSPPGDVLSVYRTWNNGAWSMLGIGILFFGAMLLPWWFVLTPRTLLFTNKDQRRWQGDADPMAKVADPSP